MKVQLLILFALSFVKAQTFVDYLDGAGLFSNKTKYEQNWKVVNATAYNFTL
jgi:hypothetical protein